MKRARQGGNWFFVDESGDPAFYDKRGNYIVGQENGSSPVLILGFVETQNPKPIRRAVLDLQQEKNHAFVARLAMANARHGADFDMQERGFCFI